MRRREFFRCVFVRIATGAALCALTASAGAEPVDYARDIKPLLRNKCFACHGPVKQEVGLRVDAGRLLLTGGDDGAVIEPGDSAGSRLIDRVTSADPDERMPLGGAALSSREVAQLREWIDAGAVVPDDEPITPNPREHWAFQPIRPPPLPEIIDKSWPRNAIDRFILARLEGSSWQPSPRASSAALLRRLSLDLTGLPPTLDEQTAFLNSTSPTAYDELVARLLAGDAAIGSMSFAMPTRMATSATPQNPKCGVIATTSLRR
jgi:hypothetical protein